MNFLLDTCVLTELRRTTANPGVVSWLTQIAESRLFLSVITLGEIQKGIARLDESQQKIGLQAWLDEDLEQRFSGRILPMDAEVSKRWGLLQGEAQRGGQPVPVVDSQLAATAIVNDLRMVTRNVRDFERFALQLLNPWTSS